MRVAFLLEHRFHIDNVPLIDISLLIANPKNPRVIKDDKYKKLLKSIQEFPQMLELRPIVVDENYTVLGGNMRLKALLELGHKKAHVIKASELTEAQKNEFIIKDNVGFGEWDWDELANSWDTDQLQEWGLDIPDFAIQKEIEDDDFEVPDEVQTDIVTGDLFEIGNHRLLCGDSTNADDVQKLLQGKEPYLMVTDPPYGVEYNADWRNHTGIARSARAIGKVNNDEQSDWTEAWALSPSKVAYVWHAGRHAATVQTSLEGAEFQMRSQIVWVKNNIVISRGDYHWKHEPCWYAVKKGSRGNWASDRKQTTVWEIDKPMKSETGHSTQKPVECMGKPIQNHDGDVYDPFCGSGTTIIAGEQLGRKVYAMEIDPKYCQIIIDRVRKFKPEIEVKVNGKSLVKQSINA